MRKSFFRLFFAKFCEAIEEEKGTNERGQSNQKPKCDQLEIFIRRKEKKGRASLMYGCVFILETKLIVNTFSLRNFLSHFFYVVISVACPMSTHPNQTEKKRRIMRNPTFHFRSFVHFSFLCCRPFRVISHHGILKIFSRELVDGSSQKLTACYSLKRIMIIITTIIMM